MEKNLYFRKVKNFFDFTLFENLFLFIKGLFDIVFKVNSDLFPESFAALRIRIIMILSIYLIRKLKKNLLFLSSKII